MINENLKTQYEIMTVKNKNETGSYIPNYDELIAEAPNTEMAQKWAEAKEFNEKYPQYAGFTFNAVYMKQMACGHYEIFQHSAASETELLQWIALMNEEEADKKCTRCICTF